MRNHYIVRDGVESDSEHWAVGTSAYGVVVQLGGPVACGATARDEAPLAGYGQARITLSPEQAMRMLCGIAIDSAFAANNPASAKEGIRGLGIEYLDPLDVPGQSRWNRGHYGIGYANGEVVVEVHDHENTRVRLALPRDEASAFTKEMGAMITAFRQGRLQQPQPEDPEDDFHPSP